MVSTGILAYSLQPIGALQRVVDAFAGMPQVLYGSLTIRIGCQIRMIYRPRNNPNRL